MGSLLRPPELLAARAAHEDGRLSADALRAAEDRAILDALAMQREVGLDVFMDGELRRFSWLSDMAEAVEGFVGHRSVLHWRGPGGGPEHTTARMVGGEAAADAPPDCARAAVPPAARARPDQDDDPGPLQLHGGRLQGRRISDHGLPDACGVRRRRSPQIIRDEIQWLIDAGVPYIQLDAPFYSVWVDAERRERMRQDGIDPDQVAGRGRRRRQLPAWRGSRAPAPPWRCTSVGATRAAAGSPRAATSRIAEPLFGRASRWTPGCWSTTPSGPAASSRSASCSPDARSCWGWSPPRSRPSNRRMSCGAGSTRRARYVPLERLALSPQCGFASVAAGNDISPDDQRRKLELVVKTARAVWG